MIKQTKYYLDNNNKIGWVIKHPKEGDIYSAETYHKALKLIDLIQNSDFEEHEISAYNAEFIMLMSVAEFCLDKGVDFLEVKKLFRGRDINV